MRHKMRAFWRYPAVRIPLAAILLIAGYYAWPEEIQSNLLVSVALFGLCLAILGGLIAFLIWRGSSKAALAPKAEGLLLAVQVSLLFFAEMYHRYAGLSGWFVGIETKTDALYFTVATAGTVGYGDIVPLAQSAKVVVTVQIIFDLVFIGAAVSVALERIRRRRRDGQRPPAAEGR